MPYKALKNKIGCLGRGKIYALRMYLRRILRGAYIKCYKSIGCMRVGLCFNYKNMRMPVLTAAA